MSSEHLGHEPIDKEPIIQWGKTEVALTKAMMSLVPLGSLFSELLTEFIPMQRRTRIEKYLYALELKLEGMSKEAFANKMADPQATDLFEEGGIQSARALSDERQRHIASVVAKGLTGDEIELLQAKRISKILVEIDDFQILILSSKTRENMHNDEFWAKHRQNLTVPVLYMSATKKEIEAAEIHNAARNELKRLGLMVQKFRSVRQGEMPELDEKTGMLKESSVELTALGRMLLVHIGQAGTE